MIVANNIIFLFLENVTTSIHLPMKRVGALTTEEDRTIATTLSVIAEPTTIITTETITITTTTITITTAIITTVTAFTTAITMAITTSSTIDERI